jgi:pSer/pThr/pTyr-binding forkhead associated (FHA) protein
MSPPTARLEVVAGTAVGTSILVEAELLIGRHAEGAGRLGEDDEISRSHARVRVDSSGLLEIEDLGSTNGTFVNGSRISAPQTLREGDTIEIGGTALVVRELPSPVSEEPVRSTVQQPTIVPGAPPPPVVSTHAPPGPPTEEIDEAPAPTLSLKLEVDVGVQEARVFLDGESEPLRFLHEAGQWRTAPSGPAEEHGPDPRKRQTHE